MEMKNIGIVIICIMNSKYLKENTHKMHGPKCPVKFLQFSYLLSVFMIAKNVEVSTHQFLAQMYLEMLIKV